MHPSLVLAKKSLLLFFGKRPAVLITFIVPIALIYLFGQVFGLNKKAGDSGPTGISLAVVNQSSDPGAQKIIDALRAEKTFSVITERKGPNGTNVPLTEEDARSAIRNNAYHFALVIPPDLISDTQFGLHLRLLSDPRNEIESQMVNGILQKTLFSSVPNLLMHSLNKRAEQEIGSQKFENFRHKLAGNIAQNFGGDPQGIYDRLSAGDFWHDHFGESTGAAKKSASAGEAANKGAGAAAANTPTEDEPVKNGAGDVLSKLIRFDQEQLVGKDVSNPMAARLVGGYAVMFLLFALNGAASSLFDERRSGILQRILSAPVRPADILWGRFLFGVLVGLIQLMVMFFAGKVIYGLDLAPHIVPLIVLSIAAAAACTAFGMLLAAVSKSQEAANGLSTLLVLAMSAIGGAWFPVSMMPAAIQKVAHFTIVYWAVEGFTNILWAGQTVRQILPNILVLVGIAVGVMFIATASFKRNKMFE
ncbi:MAG TPA: ABC transporter permease [Opitutaceae bacterium]|nr:ABC transporter permease [Opitutaceae bacterium]